MNQQLNNRFLTFKYGLRKFGQIFQLLFRIKLLLILKYNIHIFTHIIPTKTLNNLLCPLLKTPLQDIIPYIISLNVLVTEVSYLLYSFGSISHIAYSNLLYFYLSKDIRHYSYLYSISQFSNYLSITYSLKIAIIILFGYVMFYMILI